LIIVFIIKGLLIDSETLAMTKFFRQALVAKRPGCWIPSVSCGVCEVPKKKERKEKTPFLRHPCCSRLGNASRKFDRSNKMTRKAKKTLNHAA
jgi:hypothetical protein